MLVEGTYQVGMGKIFYDPNGWGPDKDYALICKVGAAPVPGQVWRYRTGLGYSWGDPHITHANGGEFDFRGMHERIFNFLTAPNISVNVKTENRTFVRWGGQVSERSRSSSFAASQAGACPFLGV